jgi:hypothetical protein
MNIGNGPPADFAVLSCLAAFSAWGVTRKIFGILLATHCASMALVGDWLDLWEEFSRKAG